MTTNSIESVFAVLKRGLIGVYHHASKKHLGRYVHEIKIPSEQDRRDEAFVALEKMAREINPDLPADLSGYEITISLSKDHQNATAKIP